MKKSTVILLIIATSLVVLGCVVFGCAVIMMNGDLAKMGTNKHETNGYDISEEFHSIRVDTDTADIELIPSDDGKCSVVCVERIHAKHNVSVEDGVLCIKLVDTRRWYEYIGIGFNGSPSIKVYIPAGEYGSLTVKASTGATEIPKDFGFESMDITASTGLIKSSASVKGAVNIKASTGSVSLENVSVGSLDISVSTGKVTVTGNCEGDMSIGVSTGRIRLSDLNCKNFSSTGSTGDITLARVEVAEKLYIKRSTGDVELERTEAADMTVITDTGDVTLESSDAERISITTDTGDVEGSLLTEKIFVVNTDTGRKDVPSTTSGGRCEITTDTGDIEITIG